MLPDEYGAKEEAQPTDDSTSAHAESSSAPSRRGQSECVDDGASLALGGGAGAGEGTRAATGASAPLCAKMRCFVMP